MQLPDVDVVCDDEYRHSGIISLISQNQFTASQDHPWDIWSNSLIVQSDMKTISSLMLRECLLPHHHMNQKKTSFKIYSVSQTKNLLYV